MIKLIISFGMLIIRIDEKDEKKSISHPGCFPGVSTTTTTTREHNKKHQSWEKQIQVKSVYL